MPSRSQNLKLALNSYFTYREKIIRDYANTFDVDSYNVTFTNFPFCTCSEFEPETFCKHIFYMLLFYYKVNIKNRIIKNIEWEDQELRNLFRKKYRNSTRRAISSPPRLYRNRRERERRRATLHRRRVLYNAQIIARREVEERVRERRIAERDRRIVAQNSAREAAERARRVATQRVARRVAVQRISREAAERARERARETAERAREAAERARRLAARRVGREVAERARNSVARSIRRPLSNIRRNAQREAIQAVRNLPPEIIIQDRRLNRSRPSGNLPNILNRPQAPRNSDRPMNSPRYSRVPAPPLEQRLRNSVSRARLRRLRHSGNITNMSIIHPPYECIGRLDKCSICMECVRSNLNIVMKCSICTNEFHNQCLDRWVAQRMRQQQMPSCPLCRSIFST